MKPFTNFESRLVKLAVNNVDTDQIIPARFLKTTSKIGLDKNLFYDWRYNANGEPNPGFVLNKPESQGAWSYWPAITSAAEARANMRRGRSLNSDSAP